MRVFDDLPATSRLWVFGSDRPLDEEQRQQLLEVIDRFFDQWSAHGSPLDASAAVKENRFLLVGLDPSTTPSGCSIDKLYRLLRDTARELDISLLDSERVFYRAADRSVRGVMRREFQELVDSNVVTPETLVFDTSLDSIDGLRRGGLERPAAESWHGAAFGLVPEA